MTSRGLARPRLVQPSCTKGNSISRRLNMPAMAVSIQQYVRPRLVSSGLNSALKLLSALIALGMPLALAGGELAATADPIPPITSRCALRAASQAGAALLEVAHCHGRQASAGGFFHPRWRLAERQPPLPIGRLPAGTARRWALRGEHRIPVYPGGNSRGCGATGACTAPRCGPGSAVRPQQGRGLGN